MHPHLTNRRLLTITLAGIAAIAFLAAVILSPLALHALARSFDLNWSNLSDVGQTYSAVSALLTALALGGVVISLLYQAKDVSTARSQAIRTMHVDLLRMELEHEDYMWASGAPWGMAIPANYGHLRRHVYVHMLLSFWESQFLLREMSAEVARESARGCVFLRGVSFPGVPVMRRSRGARWWRGRSGPGGARRGSVPFSSACSRRGRR